MNFLSTENGQSVQLFHPDEVRPRERGPFLPEVVTRTTSRYRFAKPPAAVPTDGGPLKFEMGVLKLGDANITINNLDIYRDGIIVNTRHTDDSDAVIDDFWIWATEEFGLREPETKVRRRYSSTVIVDFERSLDSYFAKFEHMQRILSNAYEKITDEVHEFRISQFTLLANLAEPQRDFFRMEIRRNAPSMIPNRYFSSAPLPTAAHLSVLGDLERYA